MAIDAKNVEFYPMVNQRIVHNTATFGNFFKLPKKANKIQIIVSDGPSYVQSGSTDAAMAYNSQSVLKILEAFNKSYEKNYPQPEIDIRIIGKEVICALSENNIKENFIYPLSEGGLAIEFTKQDTKYIVEIYNDNEDVLSKVEPGQPIKAWDLNHEQILAMLNSELK
jgi:hypothetical protein